MLVLGPCGPGGVVAITHPPGEHGAKGKHLAHGGCEAPTFPLAELHALASARVSSPYARVLALGPCGPGSRKERVSLPRLTGRAWRERQASGPRGLRGPHSPVNLPSIAPRPICGMTDDEEKQLRQELLVADLNLRRKQDIWEHPRNIALLVAATAAIVSAIAGFVGFKIGQTPAPPPVIINLPPQTK